LNIPEQVDVHNGVVAFVQAVDEFQVVV